MSQADIGWIEITTINDPERRFVSLDGSQYRSEPFEVVTYNGDWRTEFRAGLGAGFRDSTQLWPVPLLLAIVALLIAISANVVRFIA